MSSDPSEKARIHESAGRFVSRGQYDKAIKEYSRLQGIDPSDVRTLHKLGELHQRRNENDQAAKYFVAVGDSYTADGFPLKAVALYKQALRLDPRMVEINEKLAQIHAELQLTGDALAFYQVLLTYYQQQGDVLRSVETLRSMVAVDPDNVACRTKLASILEKRGDREEAIAEFKYAAKTLRSAKRFDDFLRVGEHLSALTPGDTVLVRELAEYYLKRGDQKRALGKLQICFKANNRDVGTLQLLAIALKELGQTAKALAVYKGLAQIHADQGEDLEADKAWTSIAELDANDRQLAAYRERREQQLADSKLRTGTGEASPSSVRGPPDIPRVLGEVDVYIKYGLHDKALEHLNRIFEVDAANADAHERAYAIYVAQEDSLRASEQLLNVLRLLSRTQAQARARPYLEALRRDNPDHPELPSFEESLGGVAPGNEDPVFEFESENSDDQRIADDGADDFVATFGEPEAPLPMQPDEVQELDGSDFWTEPVAIPHPPPAAAHPKAASMRSPPAPKVAGKGVPNSVPAPPLAAGLSTTPHRPKGSGGGSAAAEQTELPPQRPGASLFPKGSAPHTSPPLRPASGSPKDAPLGERSASPIPATGATKPRPIAPSRTPKTAAAHQLPPPPGKLPPPPAPLSNFQKTRPLAPSSGMAAHAAQRAPVDPAASATATSLPPRPSLKRPHLHTPLPLTHTAPATSALPPDDAEQVAEATLLLERGQVELAQHVLDAVLERSPSHPEALAGRAAISAHRKASRDAGPGDGFNLGAELAGEIEDLADSIPVSKPEPLFDEFQISAEQVISEFKKGLKRVVNPKDVDTHYDLGVAYKEMGLLDDAISEFEVARKGSAGTPKEVDCLAATAVLQAMKGDHLSAIATLHRALARDGLALEIEKALRFDLAVAHENIGKLGIALRQFMLVQGIDDTFRHVGAQVDRLSAITEPEDEAPPPAARRLEPT